MIKCPVSDITGLCFVQLWRYLKGDEAGGCRVSFVSSSSSEEMSNTDSGRGASEEGAVKLYI